MKGSAPKVCVPALSCAKGMSWVFLSVKQNQKKGCVVGLLFPPQSTCYRGPRMGPVLSEIGRQGACRAETAEAPQKVPTGADRDNCLPTLFLESETLARYLVCLE